MGEVRRGEGMAFGVLGRRGEAVPWPPRWRPWPAQERRGARGSNAWDSAERGAAALASAAAADDAPAAGRRRGGATADEEEGRGRQAEAPG